MLYEKYVQYIKELFPENSKIVVAMSGGVDSSVTAALVKRAGFETIGITLQLYRSGDVSKGKTCCAGVDIQDAKKVAEAEDFPHYVLDYTKIFKEKVIDDFVNSYEKGSTPIPCGRCNQYIKFGALLDFCEKIDADYLVTGHYVKKIGQKIYRSNDKTKDQSYFLALTTLKQFEKLNFPLCDIEKKIVKEIASEIGLIVAKKPESQDICFIPDGDYKEFLRKIRPEMFSPGVIVDCDGNKLGHHEGLAGYTIGQRKGLKLNAGPWYVINLDVKNNILVVGKIHNLKQESFEVEEVSLLVDDKYFENDVEVQIRSSFSSVLAHFDVVKNCITFLEPQNAIAPGQICAFYDGDRLLGGAIIKKKF